MTRDPQPDLGDRDEELLPAAQSAPEGDLRAFEQLVELYQKRILADCRYLTRDPCQLRRSRAGGFRKSLFRHTEFRRAFDLPTLAATQSTFITV
jgi:hypothetical protein